MAHARGIRTCSLSNWLLSQCNTIAPNPAAGLPPKLYPNTHPTFTRTPTCSLCMYQYIALQRAKVYVYPECKGEVLAVMAFLNLPVFVLLSLFFLSQVASSPLGGGCDIKAIYNFGDSISDTGNLLREGVGPAFGGIANLPYGETTFNRSTGRCSDGLLMIDYLTLQLNLPFLNPYLDKEANFYHGVNFAVAGATALNHSFSMMSSTNSSLNVQLGWFKDHLRSVCPSQEDCAEKLRHALFMVGEIGGNDYNYALFGGAPMTELLTLVPQVVQNIINVTKELVELGAVQLVIPGNFPIGCLPCYLSLINVSHPDAYDDRNCLKDLNSFAMLHNVELQKAIQGLRRAYPHAIFLYADYYNAFLRLLDNASTLGFNEGTLLRACCGGGGEHNFDAHNLCGSPGVSACDNPFEYISWDGIHMTQQAYQIMARQLTRGGYTYPSYVFQKIWKCPY